MSGFTMPSKHTRPRRPKNKTGGGYYVDRAALARLFSASPDAGKDGVIVATREQVMARRRQAVEAARQKAADGTPRSACGAPQRPPRPFALPC